MREALSRTCVSLSNFRSHLFRDVNEMYSLQFSTCFAIVSSECQRFRDPLLWLLA